MCVHDEEIPDVTRYIELHRHLDLDQKEAEFAGIVYRITRLVRIDATTKMLEVGKPAHATDFRAS